MKMIAHSLLEDANIIAPTGLQTFVSPRISRLRSNDATIRDCCIAVRETNAAFKSLLLLRQGISIEVSESNCRFFHDIARELWNLELFDLISEYRGYDYESMIVQVRLVHESGCSDCDFESPVERCS
jgi:hypothetical protein